MSESFVVNKPLLILPKADFPKPDRELESRMASAGYVVIYAKTPAAVRMMIPEVLALGSPIVQAALAALQEPNSHAARARFATRLCAALAPEPVTR